jgi:hypothetical protein
MLGLAVFGGISSTDVWVSEDQLYHWDGDALTAVPAPTCIWSIAAAAPDLALASFIDDVTFTTGGVSRWDGKSWQTELTLESRDLSGKACTNGTEFWVSPCPSGKRA